MLEEQPWTIDVRDDGNTLTVRASGELDISTSGELVDAFTRSVNGHRALVCDITDITFIDSTGVQALLGLLRREPGRFALAGESRPVERLLELTGTARHFPRVPAD